VQYKSSALRLSDDLSSCSDYRQYIKTCQSPQTAPTSKVDDGIDFPSLIADFVVISIAREERFGKLNLNQVAHSMHYQVMNSPHSVGNT
jgi:hypothetical protein